MNIATTEDGTGIVHTSPAFGADDYKVGQKNNLGIITLVDREGKFVEGVGEFSGRFVKNYHSLHLLETNALPWLYKVHLLQIVGRKT